MEDPDKEKPSVEPAAEVARSEEQEEKKKEEEKKKSNLFTKPISPGDGGFRSIVRK